MKTLRASGGVSFMSQTLECDCLILHLHISLSQNFGGVSQEGYKLQQVGQVVHILSSHLWYEMFHSDSACLYLIVLKVNTGKFRKVE
jgi:hypothetical protein